MPQKQEVILFETVMILSNVIDKNEDSFKRLG